MIKLEELYGVGKSSLKILRDNKIFTPYDLYTNVPKSYDNFTLVDFNEAKHDEVITVVAEIIQKSSFKRKIPIIRLRLKIDQFQADAIAFNQPFLDRAVKVGDTVLVKGKYHLYNNEIVISKISKNLETPEISGIYGIDGLTDYAIRKMIRPMIDNKQVVIYETLPKWILQKHYIMSRTRMYEELHFPKSFKTLESARRRLKYEEAIDLQLKLQQQRFELVPKTPIDYNLDIVKKFIDTLSFELTEDQKEAVNDIYRDFKRDYRTKRLIQGDVGSGKTIVAIIAALGAITAGKQVVFMAPTEILAVQQYVNIKKLLSDYNVELLTSKTANKAILKDKVINGQVNFLIGTHAVAIEDVVFKDLGLVIIDEQHKFGVDLRESLIKKSDEADLIYLTATPIPRTLGVAMFSDLTTSIIKSKPLLRKPIHTKYISTQDLEKALIEVDKTINKKRHAFIVVPAIKSELRDANIINYTPILKERYEDKLFVLHGDLKSDEKNYVIDNFINSSGGVLLSTSMVEVGIDIKTANVMIVLAAENFGLSQLHQLRGRVGRGSEEGYFYLVSNVEDVERLKLLESIDDGFKLSELDLKLRGPGDFLGVRQSGLFKAKHIDFSTDYEILVNAKEIAIRVLETNNRENNPEYYYLNKVINES